MLPLTNHILDNEEDSVAALNACLAGAAVFRGGGVSNKKRPQQEKAVGVQKKPHNDGTDHVPKTKASPTQDDITASLIQFCIDKGNVTCDPKLFTSSLMNDWTLLLRKKWDTFVHCPTLKQAKDILQNSNTHEDDGSNDGSDVKDNDKRCSSVARLGFGLYQEMLGEFDIPIEDSDRDLCGSIKERVRNKLLRLEERIETARLLVKEKIQKRIKVHKHDHLELEHLRLLRDRIEKRVLRGRQLNPKTIAICRLAYDEVMHFSNVPELLGDSVLQQIGLLNRDPNQQQVWSDKPNQSCLDILEKKGYAILKEIPDGRCLPRALARCKLGDPAIHDLMRKALLYVVLLDEDVLDTIDWEEEDAVFCDAEDYVVNMFCPDSYGDGYLLLAFAKLFQMKVQVHDEKGNVNPIAIESHSATLDVCHHNMHYDTLVPVPLALDRNCREEETASPIPQPILRSKQSKSDEEEECASNDDDDDEDEDLIDVVHNHPEDEEVTKINHTEQTSPKNEGQAPRRVSPEVPSDVDQSSASSQSFSALGSNVDPALGFVSATLMLRDADRFRDHVCEVNYSRQGTAEQRAKDLERRLEDGNFPLRSCFFDTDMFFQDLGE